MDISVVVVAYNEEEKIITCLDALGAQEFGGAYEIVVVDGNSTDRTVERAREWAHAARRAPMRIVTNEKRYIAAGRNAGIRLSAAEYVAFTDADCLVPRDWLKNLYRHYQSCSSTDPSTVAVGGANVPPDEGGDFHEALGVYLDSTLGSFNSPQGRVFTATRKVASLSCTNVLYHKSAVVGAGGFDESLENMSEDCDLNMRLGRRGKTLYFIPGISVRHFLRRDEASWFRNMAAYGRGRALVTFKNRDFLSPFFLAPLAFCLSFIGVPLGFLNPVFFLPLAYLPCIAVYALAVCAGKRKSRLYPRVLRLFIGTHFHYAFALFLSTLGILTASLTGRRYRPSYGFPVHE